MTSPWYNPTFVSPNTRALADSINNELAKIAAAFNQLPAPGSVGTGTSPTYVHFAYADSIDGTRNFTTGAPGNRRYIGVQGNVTNSEPSEFPADYTWSLLTSGVTTGEPDEDLIADITEALVNSANAITAAATAQATADGKVTTFYQDDAPVADGVGDLWIDTNDSNKLYRWSGSAWNLVRDAGIGTAISAAATAQSTADGKIVTFYQNEPPTAAAVGDLWIDTNDNNRLYRWSGSAWASARDGAIAIAQAQADAAASSAATANTAIANITADGVLSRDEKPEIRKQRQAIIDEFPVIRDRGLALGVSVTNYQADYTALIAYLGGLDLSSATDTAINRTTFNTFFTDYYAERQAVLDGIANRSSQIATTLPLGNANRVPFSRMENNQGWASLFNPSVLASSFDYGEFLGFRFARATVTTTAATQQFGIGNGPTATPAFKVTAGERLSVQARCEVTGAGAEGWQLILWTFATDGVTQTPHVLRTGAAGVFIGTNLVQEFFTVPAGQAFGRLELRGFAIGAGTMVIAISEPMITSAASGQTVHPPFTPGPNAYGGADVTIQQPVVSKLSPTTGRVTDPTAYNTQAILGPRNVTQLVPTYTVNASNVTVNLPIHTRVIAGPSGPITLGYGASSGVVPFSTYWTAYIDDPNLLGSASPSVVFTSNPNDLLFPGRYQISSGYSPSASGTGGSTGGGGGLGLPPRNPSDPVQP